MDNLPLPNFNKSFAEFFDFIDDKTDNIENLFDIYDDSRTYDNGIVGHFGFALRVEKHR